MHIILAISRLRKEDCSEIQASLGYRVSFQLRNKQNSCNSVCMKYDLKTVQLGH